MQWIKHHLPLVLFVASIIAVIFDRQIYAVVSLLTALALWFPSMIDRISFFRVWDLEVRLNQKISEAEKMQRLQVKLLADWLFTVGRVSLPPTVKHELEYVEMIGALDSLNSSDKKNFYESIYKRFMYQINDLKIMIDEECVNTNSEKMDRFLTEKKELEDAVEKLEVKIKAL